MLGLTESTELAALKRYWRQWTETVELFAQRRSARRALEPRAYRMLHTELLAACRSLRSTADETQREFYQNLHALAQPWLTLSALEKADHDLLVYLLVSCQKAARGLSGHPRVHPVRQWAAYLFVCAGAAGLFLLVRNAVTMPGPVLNSTPDWVQDVRFAFAHAMDLPGLSFAGIVTTAVAIYLVSRAGRS